MPPQKEIQLGDAAFRRQFQQLRQRLPNAHGKHHRSGEFDPIYTLALDAEALRDTVNGSAFNDNNDTYPSGWSEIVAANGASNTNELYGYWYLAGGGQSTSWKYRKQTTYTIENLPDNFWLSAQFSPVLFRDGAYPGNLDYYFGVYADSAGVINENQYIRVRLHWNASDQMWQVRGEFKDGVTETNGVYETMAFPPPQPIHIRPVIRAHTTLNQRQVRAYIGTSPVARTHSLLLQVNTTLDWGRVWVQIHQTRSSSGVGDYLFIGGLDFFDAP